MVMATPKGTLLLEGQNRKKDGKTRKRRTEKKVVGFSSASLYSARKRHLYEYIHISFLLQAFIYQIKYFSFCTNYFSKPTFSYGIDTCIAISIFYFYFIYLFIYYSRICSRHSGVGTHQCQERREEIKIMRIRRWKKKGQRRKGLNPAPQSRELMHSQEMKNRREKDYIPGNYAIQSLPQNFHTHTHPQVTAWGC